MVKRWFMKWFLPVCTPLVVHLHRYRHFFPSDNNLGFLHQLIYLGFCKATLNGTKNHVQKNADIDANETPTP